MDSDRLTRFRCAALRRGGATDIRVVYAANAEAARDRLIAAGLEPMTIEPVGPSLSDRLAAKLRTRLRALRGPAPRPVAPAVGPDRQPISKPLLAAAALLAAAGITAMLGSWTLALATMWQTQQVLRESRGAIARYHDMISDERAKALARPVMTSAGPTEILGRLATILPAETGVVAAGRDPAGVLRVELETADPDQIRPILARDPLFRSLREAGQAQTGDGTLRVTWTSAGR